ncbi:MAG: transglycosylase SLT domain-containing protein [Planctomycetota bacterium]|nr:transglycosylase SLT domain-containing protein [Planctomycetota bacterium]
MSARRKSGARSGPSAERKWLFLLLLVALAFFLFEGVVYGPRVVRQVWSQVGVRRVEEHAEIVRTAAQESHVDPCLLAGIMYVESRGRVDAVSSADALGLFQLKVAAAGDSAKRLKIPPPARGDLLSDPLLNARLAASHVAWLYRLEGPDLERVLVAYNAGRGKLKQIISDAGSFDAWRAQRDRDGKSETLQYARDVLRFAERFRERGVITGTAAGSLVATTPSGTR